MIIKRSSLFGYLDKLLLRPKHRRIYTKRYADGRQKRKGFFKR